ncbi:hypothetical protein [Litoribrevibacter albus]|uniref:Uncharacterized protein n=1 Tax=Litoribrevibacter albus TaxID=1473156 RepID=A0AA37SEK9_9GAMM|nr:hypothetical protein [Litoribrevibacter albus]GLQ33017.1 hypothetical protein GCM10007876_34960 [Litoribrevibacter albus]
MDEKEYLEVTAANTFCKAYSGLYQVQAAFDHLNMPRKPDVTVCIDGEPQDLEIAHLYSNEEEAKQLKSLVDSSFSTDTLLSARSMVPLSPLQTNLLDALSELLNKKSKKYYRSRQPWLVIRNASPKWNRRDFEVAMAALKVPKVHPFHEIWLIPDLAGKQGLIRLYPKS